MTAASSSARGAYDELGLEAAIETVYEHVFESYAGDGVSKYTEGAG